jgi:hypothetical protein
MHRNDQQANMIRYDADLRDVPFYGLRAFLPATQQRFECLALCGILWKGQRINGKQRMIFWWSVHSRGYFFSVQTFDFMTVS